MGLARLPPRVALFYLRALGAARRGGDEWTFRVHTRPHELATILRLARGRRRVVEIGTAGGWTAAALALADASRTVLTLDVEEHRGRERYLALAGAARERIRAPIRSGDDPPEDAREVDLLFVDGAHDEASNVAVYEAWRRRLAPGALVLFHDYDDPDYPGVRSAVERLGLRGSAHRRLFACEPLER